MTPTHIYRVRRVKVGKALGDIPPHIASSTDGIPTICGCLFDICLCDSARRRGISKQVVKVMAGLPSSFFFNSVFRCKIKASNFEKCSRSPSNSTNLT